MDSNTYPLDLSSLLAHERDLTRLARRLLTRDADAEDAVQDTLHTLIATRPPEARSLTAWLRAVMTRRVVDGRRIAAARASREAEAARPEALPSSMDTLTRIELQQQIAAAVLALTEPYRSVVAAHHFEGRSIAEIARTTGRSQATVRSQLSRAHRTLRARLEREVDGGLHALSLLLVGRGPSGLVAVAAVGVVIVVGLMAALSLRADPPSRAETAALHSPPRAADLAAALDPAVPRVERTEARTPPAQGLAPGPDGPDLSALRGLGPAELYTRAIQVRRLLRVKAFEPHPDHVRGHANLLLLPRTGLSRVRAGGDAERLDAFDRKTDLRGGGAGLSFSNGGHSVEARSDIWHTGEHLDPGVNAHRLGRLVPLGDRSLEDLDAEPPRGADEALAAAWRLCRTPREELLGPTHSALREQLEAATLPRAPLRAATSFLMRSYQGGDHDLLAAFRIVEVTDVDATIAWRVLEEYPLTDRASAGFEGLEAPWIPAAEGELASLDGGELELLLDALQARGLEVLTSLPAEALALVPSWFVTEPGVSGARRLLIPEHMHPSWRPLLYDHAGGSRCSFSEGPSWRHDLICDARGRMMTALSTDSRPILRLGVLSESEQRGVFAGARPASLSPARAAAWDLMLSVWTDSQGADGGARAARLATLRAAGVDYPTEVAAGCTYLLRAGQFGTPESDDSVIAFTILREDDYGYSLIWRRLTSR